MSKISLIVPVYNVEDYLGRCIESILSQSFSDFEVILVDDGSTDNSGNICDDYSKADTRIRVIHKENGGVSSARNEGLKYACGEYIFFCDSDDYLIDSTLETVIKLAVDRDADLVHFEYNRLSRPSQEKTVVQNTKFNNELSKKEYMISLTMRYGWEVWTHLYRRDIIASNSISFCETCGNFAEDLGFTLEYLLYTDSIIRTTEQLYVYDDTRGSSMMNSSKNQYKFNEVNEVSHYICKAFIGKYNKEDFTELHHYIILNQAIKLWNDLKKLSESTLNNVFNNVDDKEYFISNNTAFIEGKYKHRRRNPLTNRRDDILSEFLAYGDASLLLKKARQIYPLYDICRKIYAK